MTETQALLTLLRAKGWSIAAIADAVKVNYYTIYRWEQGDTSPSNPAPVSRMLWEMLLHGDVPKKRRFKKRPVPPIGKPAAS
jgi:transcriptional regulator with XRE-family HTH domain